MACYCTIIFFYAAWILQIFQMGFHNMSILQKATFAGKDTKAKTQGQRQHGTPISVKARSCRWDTRNFFNNRPPLQQSGQRVQFFSAGRFDTRAYYSGAYLIYYVEQKISFKMGNKPVNLWNDPLIP